MSNRFIESVPQPVPTNEIIVEESHEFVVRKSKGGTDVPKTVYTLDKAPFAGIKRLEVVSDGRVEELVQGSQFETRDVTGAVGDDAIAFVDPDVHPDEGTEWTVEYVTLPIIRKYTDAFATDADTTFGRIGDARDAKQVEHATGEQLDLLGDLFAVVSSRGQLNDDQYRQKLESIVPALSANGTISGIEEVIAITLLIDKADVSVVEDTSNTSYAIELDDWPQHTGELIYETAELADPVAVELETPISYNVTGGELGFTGSSVQTTGTRTAPVALGIEGSSTTNTTTDDRGLSASELEPLSTGGDWDNSET